MTDPFAAPGSAPTAPTSGWGAPQGGWGPPPAATLPDVNRWSVVALATGLLVLFPVAITAGIVALVQIRRRSERGIALAVAGIVTGGLWACIAALVAIGFALGSGSNDPLMGSVADAGSLNQGACLLKADGGGSETTPVDCAQAHDSEVYHVTMLEDGDWSGYGETESQADDICYAAFKDYIGTTYENSDFDYGYFRPSRQEWLAGERRVVCVIVANDGGKLHGSALDAEH